MTCNNNHVDCQGPVCTKATGPKRALTGKARERCDLIDSLLKAVGGLSEVKHSSSKLAFATYSLRRATDALQACNDVGYRYGGRWKVRITLDLSHTGLCTLTITYKAVKE